MNKILKVLLTANMFLFSQSTTESSVIDHLANYTNHMITKKSGFEGDVLRGLNSAYSIYKNLSKNFDNIAKYASDFNDDMEYCISRVVYGKKVSSSVNQMEMQNFTEKNSVQDSIIVEEVEEFNVKSENREVNPSEKILSCVCSGAVNLFGYASNSIKAAYAKSSTKKIQENEGIELASMSKNAVQNDQTKIIIEGIDDFSGVAGVAKLMSNLDSSEKDDQTEIIIDNTAEPEPKQKISQAEYADIMKNGNKKEKLQLIEQFMGEEVIIIAPSVDQSDNSQAPARQKADRVIGAKNVDISGNKAVKQENSMSDYFTRFARIVWG